MLTLASELDVLSRTIGTIEYGRTIKTAHGLIDEEQHGAMKHMLKSRIRDKDYVVGREDLRHQ